MRAEGDALAAVDADVGIDLVVQEDRVHRARLRALAAADAEVLLLPDPAVAALAQGAGGTRLGARGRTAGQACPGLEPGGKSARRGDADPGLVPGQDLVDLPGTGQGTGMTADAPLHARCPESFHGMYPPPAFVTNGLRTGSGRARTGERGGYSFTRSSMSCLSAQST